MTQKPIGRREAVRRVSLLLSGALVVPGALAGCDVAPRRAADAGPGKGAGERAWAPRTMSPAQVAVVAAMGEIIIPRTTTPGARDARVHEFIDTILTDFMPAKPRARFVAGIDRVSARAERAFGRPFLDASPEQQRELVVALNRAAYSGPRAPAGGGRGRRGRRAAPDEETPQQAGEVTSSQGVGGGSVAAGVEAPGGPLEADDVGRTSFFIALKRLVVEGYYTSQPGATQELAVAPYGAWRADIPYAQVGHAWA